MDFVRRWSERTELPCTDFIRWLGLSKGKFYDWRKRYGKANEHNALVPRDHWLEPWERDAILAHYLPDVSAREDGSHLPLVWQMVQGLFQWFPWYQQDEAHRIGPAGTPPEVVQQMVLEYLAAGPGYGRAYRAAFYNEDATRVMDITVPVRVIRWEGSLLKTYADRYDRFDWPDTVRMFPCEKSPEDRLRAIREALAA